MLVRQRVASAGWNALTGWQKTRLIVGTLNPDRLIGNDLGFFQDPTPASFRLNFTDDSAKSYTIQCVLEARTPAINLCQAQVDHVKDAQDLVDSIEARKTTLQAQLQHATPQEKPGIIAEIKELNGQLTVATTDLDDARRALQACRDHWSRFSKLKVTGTTFLGT